MLDNYDNYIYTSTERHRKIVPAIYSNFDEIISYNDRKIINLDNPDCNECDFKTLIKNIKLFYFTYMGMSRCIILLKSFNTYYLIVNERKNITAPEHEQYVESVIYFSDNLPKLINKLSNK